MFWLGLITGIFAYVVLVCVFTFYNYRKQKKQHQDSFKHNNE